MNEQITPVEAWARAYRDGRYQELLDEAQRERLIARATRARRRRWREILRAWIAAHMRSPESKPAPIREELQADPAP